MRSPESPSRSGSFVSFAKSATATRILPSEPATGAGGPAWLSATQATTAPMRAPTVTSATAGPAPARGAEAPPFSPSGGVVRSIPFLVRSNAQASPAVTGNPIARTATTALSTQSASPSECCTGSTT